MRLLIRLTTAIILAFVTIHAFAYTNLEIARNNSLDAFNRSMQENFGTTFTFENNTLKIIVDQNYLLSHGISVLRTSGGINPELTQEKINKKPTMVTSIFGAHSTIMLLFLVYTKTQADQVHVDAYSVDGNKIESLIFSCDFTRDLYNKISWDTLTPAEFMNKALNFKFSPWYSALARKEISA